MTPDALERALSELADRADRHVVPERVAAVHRRGRRAAVARRSAAVAGIAAVVAAVVAGSGGLLSVHRSHPAGEMTPTRPLYPAPPPTADPFPSVTPTGPYLWVRLFPETDVTQPQPAKRPGIPVVVDVVMHGRALVDGSTGLNFGRRQTDWGDGSLDTQGTSTPGRCRAGAKLTKFDFNEPLQHHYARPGTYTVRYRVDACAPVGEVVEILTITVPPG